MRVCISEFDVEILYRIARGQSYKQIARDHKRHLQTIKRRVSAMLYMFGAASVTHLIAVLIASDVLRVHDLYQELDVEVFEYGKKDKHRQVYRLSDVRAEV